MSENFSFSKESRLLNQAQFQDTLIHKQAIFDKHYKFYYRINSLAHPRLGIIAAKKKCRLAVDRNRLKRQVREAFRHYQSQLPSYDIIAITSQMAVKANNLELRQCLDNLFLRLINGSIG